MNYWQECISEAFDEQGIEASQEQIENVAAWVEGSHENYGMAHGHDMIGRGATDARLDELRRELARERAKVQCTDCAGKGWITERGPSHGASFQCYTCRGEGRKDP